MTYAHTADLSEDFFPASKAMCGRLGCALFDCLGTENAESGVSARARNPLSNASGLIELMPANLPGVGWNEGHEAFRALSATEQLEYVERYFSPHTGKLVSAAAVYTAVFLPAFLSRADDLDYVLVARKGLPDARLGWAYEANAVFDANGDGRITIRELQEAIERNATGSRWGEIAHRTGEPMPKWARPIPFDLRTTIGVQAALAKLGYWLGASGPEGNGVDGVPGFLTRTAVNDFRVSVGLPAGTNVGPRTKAALATALKAA